MKTPTLFIGLLAVLALACRDDESYPIPDFGVGAFVVAEVIEGDEIARDNPVPFQAHIGYQSYGYLTATGIALQVSYSAGSGEPVLLRTIDAVEAPANDDLSGLPVVSITLEEMTALFGLTPTDVAADDRFTITFALPLDDGRTLSQWNTGFGSVCDNRTPGVCSLTITITS